MAEGTSGRRFFGACRGLRLSPISQRRRSVLQKSFRHYFHGFHELLGHGRAHVEHFESAGIHAGVLEELLGVFNDLTSTEVAFNKVAFAFHTAGHQHGIGPMSEGFE